MTENSVPEKTLAYQNYIGTLRKKLTTENQSLIQPRIARLQRFFTEIQDTKKRAHDLSLNSGLELVGRDLLKSDIFPDYVSIQIKEGLTIDSQKRPLKTMHSKVTLTMEDLSAMEVIFKDLGQVSRDTRIPPHISAATYSQEVWDIVKYALKVESSPKQSRV